MATFQLKKDADVFTLDTAGSVSKGAATGKWTTNAANQVEITLAGAAAVDIDVVWSFNADNHFVVSAAGQQVFDFYGQAGVRPLVTTVNSALFVKPDRSLGFQFTLHPTWKITQDHLMEVTIGASVSTIDGFLFDSQGRFRYHFFDKKNLLVETILGFKGEWINEPTGDKPGIVHFQYALETAGQTAVFDLPKAVIVDKGTNQLAYSYDKAGHTLSIQLAGIFEYKDLQLSYAIVRTQDSDGKSTTLVFNAVLNSKNASGTLDFQLVQKTGATPASTLSISGNFTSQFKNNTLSVGFGFTHQSLNGVVSTSLFFTGKLTSKNGSIFSWDVVMSGKTMSIAISIQQLKLGMARVDEALNVHLENGQVVGVQALLGVSF